MKNYPGKSCVAIAAEDIHADELKEMKKICRVYLGKKTITSLINEGMRNAPADWNFIIMAGSSIQKQMHMKFSYFIENDQDILYPLANRKYNFAEATLNGLLLQKDVFKKCGYLPESNSIELCKLLWAIDAIDKGYKFKSIVGAKVC